MKKSLFLILSCCFVFFLSSCGSDDIEVGEIIDSERGVASEEPQPRFPNPDKDVNTPDDDSAACLQSLYYDQLQPIFPSASCQKANTTQIKQVNQGNMKRDKFLVNCYKATGRSCWCDQLVRPNPSSINTFHCTYGKDQVHQLIHPDESTWKYAYEAVKIVEELQASKIETQIIYNWWRPEPYNKNVGGAAGRHPFGTSIDVRFKTKNMQNSAFARLCKMRSKGRIRAIGYYASTAIHFGVGDSKANTWGKACP